MSLSLLQQKWSAKVSTDLEKATPDQIWPFFEDFFGLNKWFPGLATCHGIHGVNGEPGCIRYCAGFGLNRSREDSSGQDSSWSKERLVSIDRAQMTLTYEIVDCNIGFKSYVSTVKVVNDGAVEWCISLEPVEGWKFEDLVNKYEVGLKLMVKKMEDDALGSQC